MLESTPLRLIRDYDGVYLESTYLNLDEMENEYVAILKSDLALLQETEKWRQLQAQLLSVQESALTSERDKLCDDCGGAIGGSCSCFWNTYQKN